MKVPTPDSEALYAFVTRYDPLSTETAVWHWRGTPTPLTITYYLATQLPPDTYISSVRAIIFRGKEIMVISNPRDELYITPGGRREPDESIEETVHREILEETGWEISLRHCFGFIHYQHQNTRPPDYPYPFPDFMQVIFLAEAGRYRPEAMAYDKYVKSSTFYTTTEAKRLPLRPSAVKLLAAAIMHFAD